MSVAAHIALTRGAHARAVDALELPSVGVPAGDLVAEGGSFGEVLAGERRATPEAAPSAPAPAHGHKEHTADTAPAPDNALPALLAAALTHLPIAASQPTAPAPRKGESEERDDAKPIGPAHDVQTGSATRAGLGTDTTALPGRAHGSGINAPSVPIGSALAAGGVPRADEPAASKASQGDGLDSPPIDTGGSARADAAHAANDGTAVPAVSHELSHGTAQAALDLKPAATTAGALTEPYAAADGHTAPAAVGDFAMRSQTAPATAEASSAPPTQAYRASDSPAGVRGEPSTHNTTGAGLSIRDAVAETAERPTAAHVLASHGDAGVHTNRGARVAELQRALTTPAPADDSRVETSGQEDGRRTLRRENGRAATGPHGNGAAGAAAETALSSNADRDSRAVSAATETAIGAALRTPAASSALGTADSAAPPQGAAAPPRYAAVPHAGATGAEPARRAEPDHAPLPAAVPTILSSGTGHLVQQRTAGLAAMPAEDDTAASTRNGDTRAAAPVDAATTAHEIAHLVGTAATERDHSPRAARKDAPTGAPPSAPPAAQQAILASWLAGSAGFQPATGGPRRPIAHTDGNSIGVAGHVEVSHAARADAAPSADAPPRVDAQTQQPGSWAGLMPGGMQVAPHGHADASAQATHPAAERTIMTPIGEGIFVRMGALRATPSWSSFHVVLQPQALGMVTVHMERGTAGLHVSILPQHAATQALLDKHLPELVAQLRAADPDGSLRVNVLSVGPAVPHHNPTDTSTVQPAAATPDSGAYSGQGAQAQLGGGQSQGFEGGHAPPEWRPQDATEPRPPLTAAVAGTVSKPHTKGRLSATGATRLDVRA